MQGSIAEDGAEAKRAKGLEAWLERLGLVLQEWCG
jgi:hypothetical protein